jgi:hypothetical protein
MAKQSSNGRIFQRAYRDRNGDLKWTSTWYLKYRDGGKSVVVPTGTDDYQEAVLILRRKLAKADHEDGSDENSRVLINELFNLVIEDYRSKGRHTAYDVEHRITKQLRPFFGMRKPSEITAMLLDEYVRSRTDSAAPATVNKELAYLKRALRLGHRHDPQLVKVVPLIPMLPTATSQSFDNDDSNSTGVNTQAVQRLERHIQAKNRRSLESDMVLDKNVKSA